MVDLVPEFYINDLRVDDYPFAVIREGETLELGAPQNVAEVVDSLLRDGEIVSSVRTSNRTMVLPLLVEGADMLELAENEAILIRECEKALGTFTIDPGDGYGPPTVFDTFRIQAVHTRDDRYEAALIRRWDLTIPAQPYARSADLVTQTLVPVTTPTVTPLDDASSLTLWSNSSAGYLLTLTQQTYSGESVIRGTHDFAGFNTVHSAGVRWSGTTNTDPYLFVDICWDGDGAPMFRNVTMRVGSSGSFRMPVATEIVTHGTGTYSRYWFENTASTAQVFITVVRDWPNTSLPSIPVPLRIAGLYSATAIGGSGIQTVDTIGSVRSPGSVTATRGSAMSYLFLYSDPTMLTAGWSPAVQGSWASAPAGTYVVYVKSIGAATDLVSVTVTDAAGRASTASTRLSASPPTFRPIGEVRLGGARDGRLGALTFSAKINGATTTLTMSNVRLFRKDDDAVLTFVDGISALEVELATPSVDLERGGLWVDGWAAFDKAVTWGFPSIVAPSTALYVEADGSTPPATSLSYYPRSHTFNAYSAS